MITEEKVVESPIAERRGAAPALDCPACAAAQAAAVALWQATEHGDGSELAWENVCNTHAWRLSNRREAARRIAVARLRSQAERLAGSAPLRAERFGRRPATDRVAERGACPFCVVMTQAAENWLTQHTGNAAAGPLCVPHLTTALDRAGGREQVQALAEAARTAFAELEADLSELIRKSDYRFRQEPRGREATSWTRAAHLTAGAPAVRWTLRRAPEIEG